MFKKISRFLIVLGLTGFILGVTYWCAVRYLITQKAIQKTSDIIEITTEALPEQTNEEQKLIAITKHVFETFYHKDPATIPLYKLRPYITNKRLPEFIRLPDGVMETNIQQGFCDNASRMLAFVLEQEGFPSVQWNMVTNTSGHSTRLVTLSDDERKVFVDPFYGFVTVDQEGKLTDMETAKNRILDGDRFEDVFVALGANSDDRFYKNLNNMYMGAEGENLLIKAKLPRLNEPLILGKIDGQYKDVKSEGGRNGLTPYWHYMGHKYNREWVRVLEAQQPVKIVMTLVEPVENGILIATPSPKVYQNTLIWELDKGEQLKLQDGLAQISLKRFNSYIDVDQIAIYPTQ